MIAVRAVGTGRYQVEDGRGLFPFGRGLLQQLARLLTPGGLHHLGNAVDHHVQEAAHQQAEQHANQDQGGRVGRQVVEKQHR